MCIHTAFDNTRNYSTDERHGESVVHVELKWCLSIVAAVVRQDIQECPNQVEALTSNVGHLEDGAYPLANELGGSLDGLVAILNEDGDFLCAGGF